MSRPANSSGREGFLIAFHYQDDNNFVWWNIGGWGNTRTALEQIHNGSNTQLGPDVPVTVEAESLVRHRDRGAWPAYPLLPGRQALVEEADDTPRPRPRRSMPSPAASWPPAT